MIMYMKNIEIKLKHTIFWAFIPFHKGEKYTLNTMCHILVVKVYSYSYPTMKPTADKMVVG